MHPHLTSHSTPAPGSEPETEPEAHSETSSEANLEVPSEAGIIGAIPARYASTRLPGKVLREIAGRPMIEHVWERARLAEGLSGVVVLTDDERVARAVTAFGGTVEMTPADCVSGTDRIASAARRWRARAVVNIQGDEPLIAPEAIARVARHLAAHPEDEMVTLAAPASGSALADPNVVKVVTGLDGRALYFSRAPIPFRRDGGSSSGSAPEQTAPGHAAPEHTALEHTALEHPALEHTALRHIGIYGYQRETLLRLAALEPTPLERAESLEQLRALENGIEIRVLVIESGWPGVDTMDDLEAVERLLSG